MKSGSERVHQQCKENMFSIQTLKDFQYIDKDGKDQGTNSKWARIVGVWFGSGTLEMAVSHL